MEVAKNILLYMLELDAILKKSDFITIHIPKTSETKNLIGEKEFNLMKKTARIINCARGGIIDELALAKALESKRIAGAALDVFEEEPLPADHPLLKLDNCVVTPHLGASTTEAQVNVAIEIAESVRDALLGRRIVNAANFPSVDTEAYKVLEPYINLGIRLGKFAGQLIKGRISQVKLHFGGVVTNYKVAPITLSFMNGLLKPILGESVNFINAIDLARERAINVEEIISSKEEEFVNLIKAEIKTDQETFSIWGTVSGNKQPRVVKIDDVYVEAVPDGHILFINNEDKPGLVGALGTILGEAKVNIAGISLGRQAHNGVASSVVNVDSEVKENVLDTIRKTKGIIFVKLLKV
jgi:D-3-phosphoglycerate dehydrogenase